MAENLGKKFEDRVREQLARVDGVSIDRLHDQTNKFKGTSANICDFIVYREPYEYYIECKSVHGNTLSIHSNDPKHKYGNISNTQWEGLLEKSQIEGVTAGIICWWIDKDVTKFIPIQLLEMIRSEGFRSIRFDIETKATIDIQGKKKRVFFDYDMEEFLNEIQHNR